MLNDPDMQPTLEQLVGIQEEKPFECVGSRDEINTAIVMTIDNLGKSGKEASLSFKILQDHRPVMKLTRQREISSLLILINKIWFRLHGRSW